MEQSIVSRAKKLLRDKEKRENRRISYRVMASEAGISLSAVRDWVNNDVAQFKADTTLAICRYFNCQVGDLLQIDNSN